jgi:hypothetical protein
MRQFLYRSASSPECGQVALDEILYQSCHNNALDGDTGLLWADETMFLRLLQGSGEAIASLVDRLRLDGRHSDMYVLLDQSIDHKEFGAWEMAMPRSGETPKDWQSD